jgi:plastocyanin
VTTDDEQQDPPDDGATGEPEADAGATEPGDVLVAAPPVEPAPVEELAREQRRDDFRNRLLMPLVLPIASILVVVLVALNISRLFLAGGEADAPAVIVATVITVGILAGAAALSAARHVRTSSLVLGLSLVLVLVFSAGLITYGSGEAKEEEGGPAAPTGPAVAKFEVDAFAALKFQATEFTTAAGINEIEYVDKGGSHTLVFSDPSLSYFLLAVPGGPTKGKVLVDAGKDYDIYCTIPGHRAAGMEAVVHVTDVAAPPAEGATTAAAAATTTTTGS